jgi:hypothetical protein
MSLKTFTLTIVLLVATVTTVNAQTDTTKIPHAWWVNMGFGKGTLGSLSANVALQAEVPKHWLISASFQAEPNHVGTKNLGGAAHDVDINSGNLLFGKIYKQTYSFWSVSAGLSFVNMDINDSYGIFPGAPASTQNNRYTVGIPIVVQGYIVGLQCAGIGLNAYVNLNTLQTTAGFQVQVALGRMQTHKPKL